jgi:hypothetical protein
MLLQMDKTVEDYLAFADERTRAFLASPPTDLFDLTKEIDALIRDMCGRMDVDRPFLLFLSMNAYYLFLASIRSAISGHVSGVFPLARSGLESACYAFLMKEDSALESIWTDRDKGDQQRTACRRAFTSAVKEAGQKLRSIDQDIGNYLQDLYDASITFGAHPNVMAVVPHLDVHEHEDGKHWVVSFTCSYGEDSFEVKRALIACIEYGIMIAYMIAQLASTTADIDEVSARFQLVSDKKNAAADALRGRTD